MRPLYALLVAALVWTPFSLGQSSAPLVIDKATTSTTVKPAEAANNKAPAGASSKPQAKPAYDPILDVPPLPKGETTLVGGTVEKIDRVRNRLTVRAFGGPKIAAFFDERSHFFRDGVETTMAGVRKGDRVYVDTMSDGPRVFARNIRVVTNTAPADARGKLLWLDARNSTMSILDTLSGQAISFKFDDSTKVLQNGRAVSISDLQPGALLAVSFSPERGRWLVRDIEVFAAPGNSFTFYGRVMNLDLRLGEVSVANVSDQKTYDINFDPSSGVGYNLTVGTNVSIAAVFDGNGYKLTKVQVHPAPAQ